MELIIKAYDFAQIAHSDHKRYSGEPYFIHLVETAKTLAEFGMGPRTIAAGLLHDTIEDTDTTEETIKKEFGDEIQNIFYQFFLNYESLEQLSDMRVYRDKMQQVIKLGEKYTGKDKMPDTDSLLGVCCEDLDCCE